MHFMFKNILLYQCSTILSLYIIYTVTQTPPPFKPCHLSLSLSLAEQTCTMAVTSSGPCYITKMFAGLVIYMLQIQIASSVMIAKSRHHNTFYKRSPMIQANQTSCALFIGTWVYDDTYPVYQSSACSIIDPEFNCQMFGRPDTDYLKYRWKPVNCELPRYGSIVITC